MKNETRSVDDFQFDICDATGRHAQHLSGTMGQIDDPSAGEGTTIIDADHRGDAVMEVGDTHFGAESQITMGRRKGSRTENLTTGRAIPEESWPIPAGLTDLNSLCGGDEWCLGQRHRGAHLDELVVPTGGNRKLVGGKGLEIGGGKRSGLNRAQGSSGNQGSGGAKELECTHNARKSPERSDGETPAVTALK